MELIIGLFLMLVLFLIIGAIQGFRAAAHTQALRLRIEDLEAQLETTGKPTASSAAAFSGAPQRPIPPTLEPWSPELPPIIPAAAIPRPPVIAQPPPSPIAQRAASVPPAPPPPITRTPELAPLRAAAEGADKTTSAPRRDFEDMERAVGLRGMTFAGVALLFLGVSFFLKYAYDQDWLGRLLTPPMRIALASLVTFGVGIAGWRLLRAGMAALGQGLLGGAQALAYLTIYAALEPSLLLAPTPLIGETTAFALMALATTAGLLFAVRLDAFPMALLALIGGFLAPALATEFQGHFAYLIVLDVGVLAAVLHRRWPALDAIALCGTMLYFGMFTVDFLAWNAAGGGSTEDSLRLRELLLLLASHLTFALLPLARAVRHRSPLNPYEGMVASGNALGTYLIANVLLSGEDARILGLSCLCLSILHYGLTALVARNAWRSAERISLHLILGTAFLTASAFHGLPTDAVGAAWFLESVLLLRIGHRLRPLGLTLSRVAPIVLSLAVAHTFLWRLPKADPVAALFWNPGFGLLLVQSAGLSAFAWVHHRTRDSKSPSTLALPLSIAAGWWTLFILGLEVHRHASGHPASWPAPSPLLVIAAIQLVGVMLFALLGAGRRSVELFASGGLPLFAAGILVAQAYSAYPADATLLGNGPFFTGFATVLMVIIVQRLAGRLPDAAPLRSALAGVAQFLLLALLTTEFAAWLQRGGMARSGFTTAQWLGWVWLSFAVSGGMMAAITRQRLMLWLSAIPLGLSLFVAVFLYAEAIDPYPLLTSPRWFFALALTAAVAALGRALRPLGMKPLAAHAGAAALALFLIVGALEAYAFGQGGTLFADGPAKGFWLYGMMALLASTGGGLRAQIAKNAGLRQVALIAVFPMLGASLAPYLWAFPTDFVFLNPRFLLVAAAIAVATVWAVKESTGFAWLIFTVGLIAMTAEAPLWFLSTAGTTPAELAEAERRALFSVTLSWLVAAVPLLVLGFWLKRRTLRYMALVLFGATATKLLLLDMRGAQEIYRIIAFLLVGLVFLAASYLYHRVARRLVQH